MMVNRRQTKGAFMRKLLITAACLAGFAAGQMANALTLNFWQVPGADSPYNLSSQFSVEVTADADYFYFKFVNSGPFQSTISEMYWDDGLLPPPIFDPVLSSSGVDFQAYADPFDLPGGNTIHFEATKITNKNKPTLSGDETSQDYGIDPGEYATIKFKIAGGDYADLNALTEKLTDFSINPKGYMEPSVWVGIHVQDQTENDPPNANDGKSAAYVHKVPDGGTTAALLGLGLVGVGFLARRKI